MVLKKLKELFGSSPQEAEYLEIDLNSGEPKKSKILVRPFILKQFDDVNEILFSFFFVEHNNFNRLGSIGLPGERI